MTKNAPVAASRRLRLPRAARLRSNADFQRVYRTGSRARGDFILVVAAATPESVEAPPEGLPGARLGLSVGKRFDKQAVGRNRVKPLLREAFRLERHALPPLDLVLIPQRGRAGRPDLNDLRRELVKVAAKAARRAADKAAQEPSA